jgi:hypothetical protein
MLLANAHQSSNWWLQIFEATQSEKALYKQNYIRNPILFYLNMYDD